MIEKLCKVGLTLVLIIFILKLLGELLIFGLSFLAILVS